VIAGRFHHVGCPAFEWMVSNVVAHVDKKDNVFPNKQTSKNKIDGAVALIMAMNRAMLHDDSNTSKHTAETAGV
jgi:phage terminase large subunit-like protein